MDFEAVIDWGMGGDSINWILDFSQQPGTLEPYSPISKWVKTPSRDQSLDL